ncbi:MAG: hypothetical protein ACI4WM_03900 [Erysipelotrichaceae bacterium]
MQVPTTLSRNINLADKMSAYDEHAKNLLAIKSVTARILKYTLREFEDYEPEYIEQNCIGDYISDKTVNPGETKVKEMNSESTIQNEGTFHFDILFEAKMPGNDIRNKCIIDMEIQKSSNLPYKVCQRGIFYGGRIISQQYGTYFIKSNYQDIIKAITIWAVFYKSKQKQNTLERFTIDKHVEIGEDLDDSKDHDLFEMVIVGLGESDEVSAPDFMYTLLTDRLSVEDKKKKLAEKYSLKMTEEIQMEVTEMCNLSSMIAEENQLIGEERGFVKGEDSKSREMSIYLYNHNIPMEIIANAANTTVGQVQEWIKRESKQQGFELRTGK